MYDFSTFQPRVADGLKLVDSIAGVENNPLTTLDTCLGFLVAAIGRGHRSVDAILAVWEGANAAYDEAVCLWLLDKFCGDDPFTDLWFRDADGLYTLTSPELVATDEASDLARTPAYDRAN